MSLWWCPKCHEVWHERIFICPSCDEEIVEYTDEETNGYPILGN